MNSNPVRLHAHISGTVQGVYFRETTRQTAERLRLVGWVRNTPDGNVEVVAEGARGALESLLEFLHRGPQHARVRHVKAEWLAASGEYDTFSVTFFSRHA